MYQVSNKKGSCLTRETLAEALAAWAEKYGKRGSLHACEVMESPTNGFCTWVWGMWSMRGTFRALEEVATKMQNG